MSILDRNNEGQIRQMPPMEALRSRFPEVEAYAVELSLPEIPEREIPPGWTSTAGNGSGLSRLVAGPEVSVEGGRATFSPSSLLIAYATTGAWLRRLVFDTAQYELTSALGGRVTSLETFDDGITAFACTGTYSSSEGVALEIEYRYLVFESRSGAVTWIVESVNTWAERMDSTDDQAEVERVLAQISRINSDQLEELLVS